MISQKVLTRGDAGNSSVVAQIDSYYQDKKDDYYSREDQPSQWQGKLAEELNLTGEVSKVDFVMLMQGQHNGIDLRQSKNTKKDNKDRLGIDLTFNAPKSVSLQALVGGDRRLIDAHNQAVKETLDEIEKNADTRIKKNGQSSIENTGKLAIATFRHDTNRNNEPHLHTHSILINFTKRQDGQFRALHNDRIIKNIKEYTAMYQSNMAKRAKDLGYSIKHNSNGTFDLAHITKEQLEAFSSRSKEVEAHLKQENLTRQTATTEQKNAATLMTRKRKDINVDSDQVKKDWIDKARNLNIELSPSVLNQKSSDPLIFKNKLNTNFDLNNQKKFTDESTLNTLSEVSNLATLEKRKVTNINIQELNINISDPSSKFNFEKERKANERDNQSNGNSATKETKSNYNASNHSNATLHRELRLQIELSSPTSGKLETERTNYLPNLSSLNVVQEKRLFNVPLPIAQSEYLGNPRAEYNNRLRWSHDSGSTIGTVEENLKTLPESNNTKSDSEGLDEILTYDLPSQELVDRWSQLAKNIDFEKGELISPDESIDEIVKTVIAHITDKKVEISDKELREQLLIKGQGIIDVKSIDEIITQAITDEKIIYADTKYKMADEINDSKAVSYDDWIDKLVQQEKIDIEEAIVMVDESIKKGSLVKTQDVYVTPDHLKSEQVIINAIKFSNKLNVVMESKQLDKKLEISNLNDGQKEAAKLILNSHEQVVGVQGYAGTGKSYMLKTALKLAGESDKEVTLLAPYSAQVKSLKNDGLEANTLASFLMSKKKQEAINENSIVVVDESGVVNTKQMEQLVKITQAKKAKLVLLGDTAQTKAIEAGSPFELMQKNGMKLAVMDDIQRQKDETLKNAVLDTVNNKTDSAVKNLKNVYEIQDKDSRHDLIAKHYASLSKDERQKTIVVSGTNLDREDINDKIREQLKVAGQGVMVAQLKQTQHSKAELTSAKSYEIGQEIEFNFEQKRLNVRKGISYEVVGKSSNEIFIKDDSGKEISVLPKSTAMTIYDNKQLEISNGDVLRVTKSNKELDQAAGDIYQVIKLDKKNKIALVESDGKTKKIDLNKTNHLDHAYAITVHSSQGTTVDKVIVNLDTKSKTTNKEVFYVAISRARHEAHIYTNDASSMPEAIKKITVKNNATDLMKLKGRSYNELKTKTKENHSQESRNDKDFSR